MSAVLSDTRTGDIARPVLEPAFHPGMRPSLCRRDSLIVPAERPEDCECLLSEGLQVGCASNGTRVIDPFGLEPEACFTAPGPPE